MTAAINFAPGQCGVLICVLLAIDCYIMMLGYVYLFYLLPENAK